MVKTNEIECPHCHTANLKGALKCVKCHKYIEPKKSCPRCAHINDEKNIRCSNCGYRFKKEISSKKFILKNIILSVLVVIILLVLVYLQNIETYKHIKALGQLASIIAIGMIFITIIAKPHQQEIKYSAEEQMADKKLKSFKLFSHRLLIYAIILIIILGIFVCYTLTR